MAPPLGAMGKVAVCWPVSIAKGTVVLCTQSATQMRWLGWWSQHLLSTKCKEYSGSAPWAAAVTGLSKKGEPHMCAQKVGAPVNLLQAAALEAFGDLPESPLARLCAYLQLPSPHIGQGAY